MIDTLHDFISSNFGSIGSVASLISIPLAIYFGLKSIQKQKLVYVTETTALITNFKSLYQGIKIFHENIEVENLSITKVFIWNAGNKVINSNDIASF